LWPSAAAGLDLFPLVCATSSSLSADFLAGTSESESESSECFLALFFGDCLLVGTSSESESLDCFFTGLLLALVFLFNNSFLVAVFLFKSCSESSSEDDPASTCFWGILALN
jgi:hypothetical protein